MRKLFGTDGIRGVAFVFKNEKRRHPGTESLIRVMVEGEKAKEIKNYAEEIAECVRKNML
jgi:phosphomannomutase